LIAKGETEKAVKIMKKIARINGRSVSDEVYKSFEVWVVEDAAVGAAQASWIRTPVLARPTINVDILASFM
jgi:hypothetical protein